MKRDRNHEGYYDPTAWKAIRRTKRRKTKVKKGVSEKYTLTYRLEELKLFQKAIKLMR